MGLDPQAWPFAGLVLRTPRLVLRWPTLEDLAVLGREAAATDLSGEVSVPFLVRAKHDGGTVEAAQHALLQFHWAAWGRLSPETWDLFFTVLLDGEVVGSQGFGGRDFLVRREVMSGAWTVERAQGRGIAVEAHQALLRLVFDGLGAEWATNGSYRSNPASGAASRRIGYLDDGEEVHAVEGERQEGLRFRMDRARYDEVSANWPEVEVEGLDACLPRLGLA